MYLNHRPVTNTAYVIQHYTKKDNADIKYVCTTELHVDNLLVDIFYRETPHPKFGNKYFGIYFIGEDLMIRNADKIEDLEFGMIEYEGTFYYSNARHDFINVGPYFIDGGRAYVRAGGEPLPAITYFKVLNGEFIQTEENN